MRAWRENPEGDLNQYATKQIEREIFALQMQAKHELESTVETNRVNQIQQTASGTVNISDGAGQGMPS